MCRKSTDDKLKVSILSFYEYLSSPIMVKAKDVRKIRENDE